ncbi:MAG TPA: hypothetical protein VMH40_21890 [Myxococcaceae bacterium]|nr:hypothetical protein [Myxococcaceae bacterium]
MTHSGGARRVGRGAGGRRAELRPLEHLEAGDDAAAVVTVLGDEVSTWKDLRFQAMLRDRIGWVLGHRRHFDAPGRRCY